MIMILKLFENKGCIYQMKYIYQCIPLIIILLVYLNNEREYHTFPDYYKRLTSGSGESEFSAKIEKKIAVRPDRRYMII